MSTSSRAKPILYAVLKGLLISVTMAVAVYLFLLLFPGITSSARMTASLAFLGFGLLSTAVIAINAYLSPKDPTTPQ